MVLLESAGAVGFAGKAPFPPEWTKQKQKPRSGAGLIGLLPFVSHMQHFSSWSAKKHASSLFVIASVLVFLLLNMMSVVQLWGSILEIQSETTTSFSLQ